MIYLILFIIGWLVSGFIAYGLDYPTYEDISSYKILACMVLIMGYSGLISVIILQLMWDGKIGKHGFKIF